MIDTVYIIGAIIVVALGAAIIYANRLRLDADGDGAVTLKDAGVIVDKVEDAVKDVVEKVEDTVEEAKERVERIQEEAADVVVAVKAVAKQAKGVAKAAQGKARSGRKKKK